jgi:TM2 domain-containing membrane protein YozV
MTLFSWQKINKYLLFLIIVFPGYTFSQSSKGFADFLMSEGDYYRAITEYKRILFEIPKDSIENYCLYQISKAYWKSGYYELAVRYADRLLKKRDLDFSIRNQACLVGGFSYYEYNFPQLSIPYFQNLKVDSDIVSYPSLCLALVYAETSNWASFNSSMSEAIRKEPKEEGRKHLTDIRNSLDEFADIPPKSKFLACALSFVIPGAGQLYCGHTYDAIQAFAYTVGSIFATYGFYRYDKSVNGHLGLTYVGAAVSSIFYASNIISAGRTADYRNWKLKKDLMNDLYVFIKADIPLR